MSTHDHHADCDGWRTAHRVTFERESYGTHSRAICAECGPLHVGAFTHADARRLFSDHASEVPCDGRCRDWS